MPSFSESPKGRIALQPKREESEEPEVYELDRSFNPNFIKSSSCHPAVTRVRLKVRERRVDARRAREGEGEGTERVDEGERA